MNIYIYIFWQQQLLYVRVCMCDSERVVLGAGVETLCGEHVLMSTAAQQECRPFVRLSSDTQAHGTLVSCEHSQVHGARCTLREMPHCFGYFARLRVFNAPLQSRRDQDDSIAILLEKRFRRVCGFIVSVNHVAFCFLTHWPPSRRVQCVTSL